MENKYGFSASENSFYDVLLEDQYRSAGTWPDDVVEVSFDIFKEFTSQPPEGKTRGHDKKGSPLWVKKLPLTEDEIIQQNKALLQELLEQAKNKMFIPQTKLLLGNASPVDKLFLTNYLKYTDELEKVDLSNPTWPEAPAS